ncbi:MAG TPA: glycosyltransferase family A protein [Candidatus Binatia bacterium]|nr:glycosyltransferase family A protein [Candidatus Binatia bacterium]
MASEVRVGDAGAPRRRPDVSVVVVVYNIPRAAPRTLLSLSASYQRDIDPDDYEVIVVDNGSNPPFDRSAIADLRGNFRLVRIDPAPPSPAHAINVGLAEAKGDVIGVMIDGARMVTPGLLHFARHGARLYERAIVATLGWYLGYDFQRWSMQAGYNETREDALLASIEWPRDGYRLFEIAALDESSVDGWLYPLQESNGLFLRRATWDALGGADERFDAPGGGFLNLDTFRRAVELPDARLVILLGEATFHQLHGGVATNAAVDRLRSDLVAYRAQHQAIRGHDFKVAHPKSPPTYLGVLPRPALARVVRAALDPVWPNAHEVEPPLGAQFDRALWSVAPPVRPTDATVAKLVRLAQQEFRAGRYDAVAAIARLTRAHAPDEAEPQRLLSLVGARIPDDPPVIGPNPEYHRALAEAYRLLGDDTRAQAEEHKFLSYGAPSGAGRLVRRVVARSERLASLLAMLRYPFSPATRRVVIEDLKRFRRS